MNDISNEATQSGASGRGRSIIVIALVGAIILLVAVGGFFLLRATTKNSSAVQSQQSAPDDDGDGLSNDQEAKLGTDPKKIDTDGDGLSDKEEVDVTATDPKNAHSKDTTLTDSDWLKQKNNYIPLDRILNSK